MLKLDDLGRRGGLNALRPGTRNDHLKPESGSERRPTSLPASLRALAVSSSTRVQRSLVHRWVQGWGPWLDRGYAPGISPGDDAHDDDSASPPPGSEGGCPIKWTVRRPAGEPGSPPHATANQRDEVHVLLQHLIDDLGQASGQGHAGDLAGRPGTRRVGGRAGAPLAWRRRRGPSGGVDCLPY